MQSECDFTEMALMLGSQMLCILSIRMDRVAESFCHCVLKRRHAN